MNLTELKEQITIELDAMTVSVNELVMLQHDVANREPTIREKTAGAAFLAQFYMGIENILKRISRYHSVPLPEGETWHVALFQRFSTPGHPNLPQLFAEGVAGVMVVFQQFKISLQDYLSRQQTTDDGDEMVL